MLPRFLFAAFCLWLMPFGAHTQDRATLAALNALRTHQAQDTARVNRLTELVLLGDLDPDMAVQLAQEALTLATRLKYTQGIGYSYVAMATANNTVGKDPFAYLQKADSLAESIDDARYKFFVNHTYGTIYRITDLKRSLDYYLKAEKQALEADDVVLLATIQNSLANLYNGGLHNQVQAMEYSIKAIDNAQKSKSEKTLAAAYTGRATLLTALGEQEKALEYYMKAVDLNKKLGNTVVTSNLYNNIGERYRLTGQYRKALEAYAESLVMEKQTYRIELTQSNMADVYLRLNQMDSAFYFAFLSLEGAEKINDVEGVAWIYSILSRAYHAKGRPDSALYYAKNGLEISRQVGSLEFKRDNALALSAAYESSGNFKNALALYKEHIQYRDSMENTEMANRSSVLQYNADLAKKQGEIMVLNQKQKLQQTFLFSALVALLLIIGLAIALLRNNRHKQKVNNLLLKQKRVIEEQRDKTNKALADLQSTQTQLIQSEKMASLGELTAGIAHEIQNPLNFVNNFSEVNKELLEELKEELEKGNKEEVISLANSVIANQEKINHHGKRADGIVKSMLQHSRKGSGSKELTDINALADEYLRLSYHGLRAKDKSFNANYQAELDLGLKRLEVFPQELGRVILNLLNNAFYAVTQRAKSEPPAKAYKPAVTIKTQQANDYALIIVQDNGNGIPDEAQAKLFQPFFTTKPTGAGTGLGLSLSYDIVKAHGGNIEFNTEEGKGTAFYIKLPMHSKPENLKTE